MCRYGFHRYKNHYLCFNCRKQFKKLDAFDVMGKDLTDRYVHLEQKVSGRYQLPKYNPKYDRNNPIIQPMDEEQAEYEGLRKQYFGAKICPECSQPMAYVGKDIKAPKMRDKEAWKTLQNSYTMGYTFHSCGCGGPGFVPKDKEQYKAFLEKNLASYRDGLKKSEVQLATGIKDTSLWNADKFYWHERIDKIEAELKKFPKNNLKR